MKKFSGILALLVQEVRPAMGCTEPAAVALAASHAASVLSAKIKKIHLKLSPSILKNGMGVGIPNTGMTGLEIAAALGAVVADPTKQLLVLENITKEQLALGKELARDIDIEIEPSQGNVYVEVIITDGKRRARAVIRHRHTWLHLLELDDEVIKYQEIGDEDSPKLLDAGAYQLEEYFNFCVNSSYRDLLNLDMGEVINRRIAEYGLSRKVGMEVGRTLMYHIEKGLLGDDIHHHAMVLTAAATDARMSGCNLPVISNTGSGNQGLSITLPIIAAAEKLKTNHEELVRALALGHLINIHMKNKLGLLSCLCGCLSAAAGAAGGMVLLLGGDYQKVECAIKNMIGNTTGMVCDGAKEGCSMKVATNTSAAVQSALLASMGKCVSAKDGIVTDDVDETIDNLAKFINTGMQNADRTIISIMMNKKNNHRGQS